NENMPANCRMDVWEWRKPAATAGNHGLSRRRALIQACVMAAVAGLLYAWLQHRIAAGIVGLLALLMLAGSLGVPGLLRGFEKLGAGLGRTVGLGMTYLLLTPMYYLIFTPGRFLMALSKRDPMQRRFLPEAATYWQERAPIETLDYYNRQY
ncbi:MAG: hypothetical protein ABR497_03300, partial [Kiritimatiellia bacterium]